MLLTIQDPWFDPYKEAITKTLQTEQADRRGALIQAERLLRRWCRGLRNDHEMLHVIVREHPVLLHEGLIEIVVELLPQSCIGMNDAKLLAAISAYYSQFAQWQIDPSKANTIAAQFASVRTNTNPLTACYRFLYGIHPESVCHGNVEVCYEKACAHAAQDEHSNQKPHLLSQIELAYSLHILRSGNLLDAFAHYNAAIQYARQWFTSLNLRHYALHDAEVVDAARRIWTLGSNVKDHFDDSYVEHSNVSPQELAELDTMFRCKEYFES